MSRPPLHPAAASGGAQDAHRHSGTNPTAPVRPEHGAAVERSEPIATPPPSGGPASGLGIAGIAGTPGAGSSHEPQAMSSTQRRSIGLAHATMA